MYLSFREKLFAIFIIFLTFQALTQYVAIPNHGSFDLGIRPAYADDNQDGDVVRPPYKPPTDEEVMLWSKLTQLVLPIVLVGVLLEQKQVDQGIEAMIGKLAKIYHYTIPTTINNRLDNGFFVSKVLDLTRTCYRLKYPDLPVEEIDRILGSLRLKYLSGDLEKVVESIKVFKQFVKDIAGLGLFKFGADAAFYHLSGGSIAHAANIPSLSGFITTSYLGWRVLGDNVVKGKLFPLYDRIYEQIFPPRPALRSPKIILAGKMISKWFHEIYGKTITTIPVREVLLKMFLIGTIGPIAWQSADVGFILQHSGDFVFNISGDFLRRFWAVAFSGYFGYIWGHNTGETIYHAGERWIYGVNRLFLQSNIYRNWNLYRTNSFSQKSCFSLLSHLVQTPIGRIRAMGNVATRFLVGGNNPLLSRFMAIGSGAILAAYLMPVADRKSAQLWSRFKSWHFDNFYKMNEEQLRQLRQITPIERQDEGEDQIQTPIPQPNYDRLQELFKEWEENERSLFPEDTKQSSNSSDPSLTPNQSYAATIRALERLAIYNREEESRIGENQIQFNQLQELAQVADEEPVKVTIATPSLALIIMASEVNAE